MSLKGDLLALIGDFVTSESVMISVFMVNLDMLATLSSDLFLVLDLLLATSNSKILYYSIYESRLSDSIKVYFLEI